MDMYPMDNLTFSLGVIKHHVPSPLEGYEVVVFERLGVAGEEFRYSLRPGERPPKRTFRLSDLFRSRNRNTADRFFAFAVTNNPALRTSGATEVITQDQIHRLTLTVSLEFYVSDARLLVIRRADDPVAQITREAETLVSGEIARYPWAELRHNFNAIEHDILIRTLGLVRQYSANFGLWVDALSFRVRTSDHEMRAMQEAESLEMQAELQRAELEKELVLQPLRDSISAHDRRKAILDAASKAVVKAIENAGTSVTNVAELAQAVEAIHRAQTQLARDQRLLPDSSILTPSDSSEGGKTHPPEIEVAFRAVWPSIIWAATSSPLNVYAYIGSEGAVAVAHDIHQSTRTAPAMSGAATLRRVHGRARIRITPTAPGIQFEPPSILLPELSSWLRANFQMRSDDTVRTHKAVSGVIQFFVGPLEIGHLAFSLAVRPPVPGESPSKAETCEAQAAPYRRIFVSYSHRDWVVVSQLERAYKVLGDTYFRDIDVLRSGQDWRGALLLRISDADVFQLCWSSAAKRSRNVEEEWRHALSLARNNFIHPVYWQKPMPKPPTELAHIHFAFYEVPTLFRKRNRSGA